MEDDDLAQRVKVVFPTCPLCLNDRFETEPVKEWERIIRIRMNMRCSTCTSMWSIDIDERRSGKRSGQTMISLEEKGENPYKIPNVKVGSLQHISYWDEIRGKAQKIIVQAKAGSLMLDASEIIRNANILTNIHSKYVLVFDRSVASFTFDNLVIAINLMAEKGWRCVNVTVSPTVRGAGPALRIGLEGINMYALMEKT